MKRAANGDAPPCACQGASAGGFRWGVCANPRRCGAPLAVVRLLSYPPDMSASSSATAPPFTRFLAQVEQMVRESGDPERASNFDAADWLAAWLASPTPALGGRPPAEYLHSPEGCDLVSRLLGSQQSGAYW